MHMQQQMRIAGFTLVEMSVVIVIIGLIVGGVSFGNNMINRAKLGAVIAQIQEFKAGYDAFGSKYMGIPGDLSNASVYWGDDCLHVNAGTSDLSGCDGNGNLEYDFSGSTIADRGDPYRFFRHLQLANMIDGDFLGHGRDSAGDSTAEIGTNVPTSKLGGAWFVRTTQPQNATFIGYTTSSLGSNSRHNFLQLADIDDSPTESFIDVDDMRSIDRKIDDDKPGFGKVLAAMAADCAKGTSTTDSYDVAAGNTCQLFFKLTDHEF